VGAGDGHSVFFTDASEAVGNEVLKWLGYQAINQSPITAGNISFPVECFITIGTAHTPVFSDTQPNVDGEM
jgi:hypothetical protein